MDKEVNKALDLLNTVAVVRDGSEIRFDEALDILRRIACKHIWVLEGEAPECELCGDMDMDGSKQGLSRERGEG